ncbi:hypothetical protein EC968_008906 [Mortierella alpina]|nr:hypothetical protein EC968_008906 [Mortierella alpina]
MTGRIQLCPARYLRLSKLSSFTFSGHHKSPPQLAEQPKRLNAIMTKSIQPQLATAPKTPQSKSSNSSPGTKKKSLFSPFSSKNVIKSSKDGLDKTLNSALVAAGMPANVSRRQSEILLPEVGDSIKETAQLVFCARLLVDVSVSSSTSTVTKPNEEQLKWIREMESQPLEREHLYQLMDRMIDRFIEQPTKRSESICEIVLLGPVLGEESYQWLLRCFLAEFDKVPTLTIGLLQGLVQLIQDAPVGYLHADDLILILRIIRRRLEDSAQQFEGYSVHLTLAISKVLDVMASQRIQGLNRVQEHKPLLDVLSGLKTSKDPFLQYQAHYAFQALQWVPDDETQLQRSLRHFAGMANSLAEISAVMRLDFKEFLEGLQEVQKIVKDTYDAVKAGWESAPALIEDGRGLLESLKEGFGSGHKHPWYITLRGAVSLVREGQLADLNKLICEAPCRQHPLFQWGICELLGEIAVDPFWNEITRSQAINLLGEMYKAMEGSNLHLENKQWVLTILHHISDLPSLTLPMARTTNR